MEPNRTIKLLTEEIIDHFRLPKKICYNFIYARVEWAFGVGFDLGRSIISGRKSVAQCDKNSNKIIKVYPSMIAAARDHDLHVSMISKVCLEERKSAAGFRWRFVNPNEYYVKRKLN